ncbi:hypothetical protein [Microbacterium sp. 2RAF4]|uniref:hypothetical protein n=1 Tax=Microbacterium sp. 2RAF4 TaxID=3232999 RepID=UPI003F97065F
MKFDWYLFIGLLSLLVFIVTRWVDNPFASGFGLALGLSSILMFGVSITTGVRKSRGKKA